MALSNRFSPFRCLVFLAILALSFCTSQAAFCQQEAEKHFREQVVPIFQRRCLSCHNDTERKGGLSLETAESLSRGGDSGPILTPGDPDASYLIELITSKNGRAAMPKKADPLGQSELQAITRWVRDAAVWPKDFRVQESQVESADWWSLRPLTRPSLPSVSSQQSDWIAAPIDTFIAAKHAQEGLHSSPEADRRTLIRRLYFDLLGLPPSPDDADTFISDEDELAYEKLVDRILGSPSYGERWARHWLDVVHYGETHGYDKDKPRLNAWPYRDYVIRSLNSDKPYGQFVQEQVAGDVLFPSTIDGIEALGFIAAGPWDFIGHAEVPETKIDGKIARHLDRDDMVSNTMNTFCSLTVHCAQCHNHKFDPILQDDYYSLQAVFAALDRADKEYDLNPELREQRTTWKLQMRDLAVRQKKLDEVVVRQTGLELADLDRQIAAAKNPTPAPPEHGYHSAIEQAADRPKWVQLDLGKTVTICRVEFVGCSDDFNDIGAGFGFPPRYKIEVAEDASFQTKATTIVDRTVADHPNPGISVQSPTITTTTAQYVRFTATKLAPRKDDFIFALAELKLFDSEQRNVARDAVVSSLDSIEAPIRWGRKNLVDGIHPQSSLSSEELDRLKARRDQLWLTKVDEATRTEWLEVARQTAAVKEALAGLESPRLVYAGTVYSGTGAFSGTGPMGAKPRPIHVLARGDVQKPLRPAVPGALQCVSELPSRFEGLEERPEGERRAALAKWLADRRNPLTWRSLANRVWLYHFGRGIVDTPNDFGRMGQAPTHPELLDWMACHLRDEGQSIKSLHRAILLSSVYRQASQPNADTESHPQIPRDVENRYYSRMSRRRLEAEAIRDSILYVSGQLRSQMGGPSFQDFVIDKPEHSPHYEYHLHEPNDPRAQRRSVYRFIVRSQTQPFMTTLDCADPSMLVDKRNQTITPLQALTLLNNQLTISMAKNFADRVQWLCPEKDAQAVTAFRLALSRRPTTEETATLVAYSREHGLANTCRVILNLNEFVFVD